MQTNLTVHGTGGHHGLPAVRQKLGAEHVAAVRCAQKKRTQTAWAAVYMWSLKKMLRCVSSTRHRMRHVAIQEEHYSSRSGMYTNTLFPSPRKPSAFYTEMRTQRHHSDESPTTHWFETGSHAQTSPFPGRARSACADHPTLQKGGGTRGWGSSHTACGVQAASKGLRREVGVRMGGCLCGL